MPRGEGTAYVLSDIHIPPTDRGTPAMVQGERLRPQTDISRLKVSDVCGHGREVGDFGAKETEEP